MQKLNTSLFTIYALFERDRRLDTFAEMIESH